MQRTNVWLTSRLLGDRVRNSAGENIGKIEDLLIDPPTGNLIYAIISLCGLTGAGDKLFAIPWHSLRISPSLDYIVLDADPAKLKRAPAFDRDRWPDLSDPVWQNRMRDYYGVSKSPVYRDTVYMERRPPVSKKEMSVLAGVLLVCSMLAMLWVAFLVWTRGWDQAKMDIRSSVQSVAYAMKETSQDAALTAKVKTAFALSKRIPAGKIHVDSENDVVTLRGEVPTGELRTLADTIARDTPGVREVHNYLYVTGQSP